MIEPGKINTLRVVKTVDFGIYLDGGEMGEILMPAKWVPEGTVPEDSLDVFIYFDSEDRPIATTLTPRAMVGDFSFMRVKQVNRYGAFLDWGLDKDLLVPYREQNAKMIEGRFYLVYLYVDPLSKRIAASARLDRFLDQQPPEYIPGDEVDVIVWTRSDLGYNAIIDKKHTGMIYENQVYSDLETGTHLKAWISKVRPDNKIDLVLQKPGYQKIGELASQIMQVLEEHEGFMEFTDKSPAEEIYKAFNMSKKNFKKALGGLYKNRMVVIEENGIRVIE